MVHFIKVNYKNVSQHTYTKDKQYLIDPRVIIKDSENKKGNENSQYSEYIIVTYLAREELIQFFHNLHLIFK